ncbi:MAG: methyltransferase domain-containing protein [Parcubacteria group bacterium]|jgi:SAM-dependent methyltransferase
MNRKLRRRYDNIARTGEQGLVRHSHIFRPDLMGQIVGAIDFKKLPINIVIYDVGCGEGHLGFSILKASGEYGKSAKLRLIDFSGGMLQLASRRAMSEKYAERVKLFGEDMTDYFSRIGPGSAGVIAGKSFLQDIPAKLQPNLLRDFWKALAPEGQFVGLVYCATSKTQGLVNSLVALKDMLTKHYDPNQPRYIATKEELMTWLKSAGFREIEICTRGTSLINYFEAGELHLWQKIAWLDQVEEWEEKGGDISCMKKDRMAYELPYVIIQAVR